MLSVLAIIVAVSFLSMAALYLTTEAILSENISDFESKATAQAAQTFRNNLHYQIEEIASTADDWAAWDETYIFIKNNNTQYVTNNLMDATFTNLDLDFMVYVNSSKQIVFSKSVNGDQTSHVTSQAADQLLSDYDLAIEDSNRAESGIVFLQEVPVLVAAHPILNSFHDGPVEGVLIMGRYIDDNALATFSEIIGLPLKIFKVDSPSTPNYVKAAAQELSVEAPIFSAPINETYTAGFTVLEDTEGAPVMMAEVDYYRSAYIEKNASSTLTSVSFAVTGVVFFAVTLLLLDRTMISRLTRLNTSVIASAKTDLQQVKVEGNDEISNLACSINNMLCTIDKSQKALNQQAQTLELNVQKRTRELSENQEKIKSILGASPDAIIAADLDGRIIEANQKMVALSGAQRDDLIGAFAADFIPSEFYPEVLVKIKAAIAQRAKAVSFECLLLRKDGSVYPAEASVGIIGGSDGEILGVVAVVRDITEKRQIQERLFNSERLAGIGQTAGMVGHDIRNPLQAILGDLYLLRNGLNELPEKGGQREELHESIESIEDNVVYINKIVSDLQDYTRTLKPKKEAVSLKVFISNILSEVNKPETVAASVVADDLSVNTDAYFLRRILTNLVINALQAMPDGGILSVYVYLDGDEVVIKVQDTGVGISKEAMPNLFKPLFTTKSKGQGLGLAVIKRFVDALNGAITVESEEGKGTAFIIRLPC